MTIGGHVSIAGGIALAPERAAKIGGNALQMFSASPRGWNLPHVAPAEAEDYKNAAKRHRIGVAYFHASYLINLADDGFIGDRSVDTLIAELRAAEELGVRGSIVHLGSFKDERKNQKSKLTNQEGLFVAKQETNEELPASWEHPKRNILIRNINAVLKNSPENTFFIIEGMGTRKIGRTLDEIGNIFRDVRNRRLKVCLDTCHLHVAGYDLSTKEKLDDFLEEFDQKIGLKNLECVHINDSRDPFGSMRDRHANIGEGKVPQTVFKLLLNHPRTKNIPFILEVPGFDGQGPDKKNMDILRAMVVL